MAQCQGNHIHSMQLFYVLKQKYPNIPDRLVSHCMKKAGGNEKACEELLESPEFSSYRIRRLNTMHSDDKDREEAGACALPPPTPCSITRRVPPRASVASSYMQYNRGLDERSDAVRIISAVANNYLLISQILVGEPSLRSRYAEKEEEGKMERFQKFLIQAQLQRKKNLELEVEKDKKQLENMQKRHDELKLLLRPKTTTLRIKTLNEEIDCLQQDCIKLYNELDSANVLEVQKPISVRTELFTNGGEGILLGGEAWRCELCTFRNHPLLNQCETCMMPRITLGIKA